MGATDNVIKLPVHTDQAPSTDGACEPAKLELVTSTTSKDSTSANVGAITTQPMLSFALKYIDHGWPVLLAKPNTKDAYFGGTVKSAMCDPAEVQAAFATHPNSNIAIVPGQTAGIVVLDVDTKNNKPG